MRGINIYEQQAEHNAVEKLINEHSILVVKIAKKIKRKLPSYIELNDLLQSGFVGLLEANKSFDATNGASFESYASIRIRGAILDYLRKNSWKTRDAVQSLKQIGDAVSRVEQRTKKQASSEEIAAELKMSIGEYDKICQKINVCNVASLDKVDELFEIDDQENPENVVIDQNIKVRIKDILSTFAQREQILLSLYYIDELTFKEISEVLDITEARVSQLHAVCIAKIKKRLAV